MGRKYGLGKYGRGTYDLGGEIPPWIPIPIDPVEIWTPEVVVPPGNWVPSSGTGSEIWAPVASMDSCWGGKRAEWPEEKWIPVTMPVVANV